MKQFPIELLQPKSSQLNATIFKNDFLEIPETPFYSINIDLKKFQVNADFVTTSIHLDFIKLDIFHLKELENQVFEFPINPEKGFIDGSIYLFDVHNPIDVPKIEFGKIENNSIKAILYFDIDFEYEKTGYSIFENIAFSTKLHFGALSIDTDIMNADNFNEEEANKLVAQFVSLQDYEKVTIENNQIRYQIKSLNL